ncbi:hypothetical protein Tco_0602189 [Tanacetum coccineum]
MLFDSLFHLIKDFLDIVSASEPFLERFRHESDLAELSHHNQLVIGIAYHRLISSIVGDDSLRGLNVRKYRDGQIAIIERHHEIRSHQLDHAPFWNTGTTRPDLNKTVWRMVDGTTSLIEKLIERDEIDKAAELDWMRYATKQKDWSCVHASNKLHLHVFHVVVDKYKLINIGSV